MMRPCGDLSCTVTVVYLGQLLKSILSLQMKRVTYLIGWTWGRNKKEMATHSSVLAWRIPGTGEPGGLPSMGSHRVGHN